MSEKIEGMSEQEVKRIDYRSNEKEYHIVFPGSRRNRYGDPNSNTEYAYTARKLLIDIAMEERKLGNKGTLSLISKSISESIKEDVGESGSKSVEITRIMLSRAASGTLSDTPTGKYMGKSPREFVLQTLKKYYQEHYQPQEDYII